MHHPQQATRQRLALHQQRRSSLQPSNTQEYNLPHLELKIGAILSCAKGYELNHPRTLVPHYRYIPTLDQDECDISVHFDDAADFIRDSLRHTNVLAHCIAGVSRSVSMVIAYLIREHKLNYDEAYRLVKSKRKIVPLNPLRFTPMTDSFAN